MRAYVRNTAYRWEQFQKKEIQAAEELKTLVMDICHEMSAAARKKQIEAMLASRAFDRLRELAHVHASDLGIREKTDQELALWIRTICFCDVMKQEHAA